MLLFWLAYTFFYQYSAPNRWIDLTVQPDQVEMDELTALREITAQLTKIQFDQDVELNRSIDFVLRIDRKTYKPAKKITHKYLTALNLDKK